MPAIKLKKVTAEYLAEKEKKEAEKLKEKEKTLEAEDDLKGDEEEVQEKEVEYPVENSKVKNFLDVEILHDKRKRSLPATEQNLVEWLDSNLVKKDDVYLPMLTLYTYYSEVCQMQGNNVVDVPVFGRYLRDKFGKCFGFQENSPYKELIEERKRVEKKPKVEGESSQIKIRDVIKLVIEDLGNFYSGYGFKAISKSIIQKYPTQRVDMYPKRLKSALERGVHYGWLELVRGVGMCGVYRLPGEPTKEEEVKKPKMGEEEGGTEEEKATKDDSGDSSNENTEEGAARGKSGDKSQEEESGGDAGGSKGDEKGEKSDGDAKTEEAEKKKLKRKKRPKKKAVSLWAGSELERHCNPQKVEDVFPLAITYQSDPKQASMVKIRNYIQKFYHYEVAMDKMKRALEKGQEDGWLEHVGGTTWHLLSDTFFPGRSEKLSDQIAQAIVACSEPKTASSIYIKKYINEYHKNFNIEEKPHIFKSALERACSKGILRQMSGIGSSGSFQLLEQFYPSPAILAGDTSDSEEEVAGASSDEGETEYVPRPTKRGRLAPKHKEKLAQDLPARRSPTKNGVKKSSSSGVARSESARGSKARNVKEKSKRYVDVDSSDEENDVEYEAAPSRSRGSPAGKATKDAAKTSKKEETDKKTPKKVPHVLKSSLDEGSSSRRRSTSRPNYRDDNSDDEVEDVIQAYVPRPSKSRGGGTSKKEEETSRKEEGTPKKEEVKPNKVEGKQKKEVKPNKEEDKPKKVEVKQNKEEGKQRKEDSTPKNEVSTAKTEKGTPKKKGNTPKKEGGTSIKEGPTSKKADETDDEMEDMNKPAASNARKSSGRQATKHKIVELSEDELSEEEEVIEPLAKKEKTPEPPKEVATKPAKAKAKRRR